MVDWSVYFVTQEPASTGHTTPELVEAAIEGGAGIVQLCETDRSVRDRLAVGRNVRDITREAGVPLVVNDRVDLAKAIDADGVHLGNDGLPIQVARDVLGIGVVVGRSVSAADGAVAAEDAGADYLCVGPMSRHDSGESDPAGESAIGQDRVASIVDAVSIPVVGSGETVENATDNSAAGATGMAVTAAIAEADDPVEATRELRSAVERGRTRV